MSTPMPEERPALRRADDASVHPIAAPPVADHVIGDLSSKAGATTSDTMITRPDKLVTLELRVPKSLRKALRSEAERRGMSVDELVTAVLRDRTAG